MTYNEIRTLASKKSTNLKTSIAVYGAIIYRWRSNTAGMFTTHLMNAIAAADSVNTALLYKAYPDEVLAYTMYTNVHGWWEAVKEYL